MFLFNKKKNTTPSNTQKNIANKSLANSNSPAKVILIKAEAGLDRHIVKLQKEKNVDLTKHRARVFVVLDRSGSMYKLFYNGSVQETLTRLLPLALRFDDNGELEVYVFNNHYTKATPMTINNFESYVEKELLNQNLGPAGGTSYAPIISKTIADYKNGSPYPAFGIFITDGENDDPTLTDNAIKKSSKYKIFYQFIGIGNSSFKYLEKLDDLDGRSVDNTAFIRVADFCNLDDDQLYEKLLEQYPQWLKDMHIN